MTDPSAPATTSDPDVYPPNVLGVSAIILSLTGIFFVFSFGVASLLGIGLGIGSLVRSRRRRGQKGGVGIVAIALGIVGLGVTAFVFARILTEAYPA